MISVVVLLLEFVVLALFNSTGTSDAGNFVTSILILLHVFFTTLSFNGNKKLKYVSNYLVLAYLLRLFLLYIDLFAYPQITLPDGHADENIFYWNATYYATGGETRRGFYPKLMGTLFKVIGTNRLFGQYISMLGSVVALAFLAYSLYELNINARVKKRIMTISCLMPYNAILASLFVREAFIHMFLSMSYYYFVLWAKEKKEHFFYIASALVLPAALFHGGTVAALVGYIIIRLIYNNKTETVNISFKNIMIALMIALVAVFLLNNTGGLFTNKISAVDSLEDIANTADRGASSYAQYVGNSNNLLNLLIYSPLRILFFVLSPVPWLWRGLTDIIAFCFGAMFYVISLWNMIKFLRKRDAKNRSLVIALFVIAAAITFVFAWGTTNAGTASRHREKMQVLFAILWALSYDGLCVFQKKRITSREDQRQRKGFQTVSTR